MGWVSVIGIQTVLVHHPGMQMNIRVTIQITSSAIRDVVLQWTEANVCGCIFGAGGTGTMCEHCENCG